MCNSKAPSSTCYDEATVTIYANRNNRDTGFIAYRDLPQLLKELYQSNKNKALDFGCGSGFSSWLLLQAGYEVIGVDSNDNMLEQARSRYGDIKFSKIAPGNTPFLEDSFDLIMCAFVLLEMPSLTMIKQILREFRRIIKVSGKLVVVTSSEYLPKNDWLTAVSMSKNQHLEPGQNYQILDTENNMVFSDFYYDDHSYKTAHNEAGFTVNNLYQPLGKKSDGIEWTTEWKLPPYSIYISSPVE
jgi:ubiquinone/menaquinone biosynthesis C-methylase UbiE